MIARPGGGVLHRWQDPRRCRSQHIRSVADAEAVILAQSASSMLMIMNSNPEPTTEHLLALDAMLKPGRVVVADCEEAAVEAAATAERL